MAKNSGVNRTAGKMTVASTIAARMIAETATVAKATGGRALGARAELDVIQAINATD